MQTIAEVIEKQGLKVDLDSTNNIRARQNLINHGMALKKFACFNAVMVRKAHREGKTIDEVLPDQ